MSLIEMNEALSTLLGQEGFLGPEFVDSVSAYRLLQDTPINPKVVRVLLRQWSTLLQVASQRQKQSIQYQSAPSLGDEKNSLSVEIPLPRTSYIRGESNVMSSNDSGGVRFDFIVKRLVATLKAFILDSVEETDQINKQKQKVDVGAQEVEPSRKSSQSSVAKVLFMEFIRSGGQKANGSHFGHLGWNNRKIPEIISAIGDASELLLRVVAQCSDCRGFGAPRHLEEMDAHLSASEKVEGGSLHGKSSHSDNGKVSQKNTKSSSLFSKSRDVTEEVSSRIRDRWRPQHPAHLLYVSAGSASEMKSISSTVKSLVSLFDAAVLWYSRIRSKTGWTHINMASLSINAAERVIKPLLLIRSFLVVSPTTDSTSQEDNDDTQGKFIIDKSTTAADVLCSEAVHMLIQDVVSLRLPYIEACGNVLRMLISFPSSSSVAISKKTANDTDASHQPPKHFLNAISFLEDSICSLRPVHTESEIVSWISAAETLSSERLFGFREVISIQLSLVTPNSSPHFFFNMLFDAMVLKVQSPDRSNFMDLHLIAWCASKGQNMTIDAINAIIEKYQPYLSDCPLLQKLGDTVRSSNSGGITPQRNSGIEVTLELTLCSLISTICEANKFHQQNRTAFILAKAIQHDTDHRLPSLHPITCKSLLNGIFYGFFYLRDIEKNDKTSASPDVVSSESFTSSICGIGTFRDINLPLPIKTINNSAMAPMILATIKNTTTFKTGHVKEEGNISAKLDGTVPVAFFIVELVRKWSIGAFERTILSLSTTGSEIFGSASFKPADWSLALFHCSTLCCTLLSHCTNLPKELDLEKENKVHIYHLHFSRLLTSVTFLIPLLFDTLLVTSKNQLKMTKTAIDIMQRKYMIILKEIIHATVKEMGQLVHRAPLMWCIDRLKEGDWGLDGKPPKWKVSEKPNVIQKSPVMRIADIRAYTMITPLEVLTMKETVNTTTDREILEVYVPVAQCAIQSRESLNVLNLGFAVLVAPILAHRSISPLLIPTLIAIYCPNLEEIDLRFKNSADDKVPLWPYYFPSIQQLTHFATNIRPVMQALERCPSTSSCDNLATFLNGNSILIQNLEGAFKRQELKRGDLNDDQEKIGTFSEICEAISPSSAQLYVIQSLFTNANYIIVKYFVKAGPIRVASNTNYQLFVVYMSALSFLVQCEDANVVARCCAALEVLLRKLSKRERERWLLFIENVIATSKSDTTRVDLAVWLLGLRNTIISKL